MAELTPEIDQAVLDSIKARIEQERLKQISTARGAATARGLGGSSFQAVQEGIANRGATQSLADSMATMALERAKLQREERLIGEERKSNQTFAASESNLARRFQGGEAALDRAFTENQNQVNRQFQQKMAYEQNQYLSREAQRQRRSEAVNAGIGAVGGGLGTFFALCFAPDTMVEMADGSKKAIKDIVLGDETRGGTVASVRYALAPDEMFSYLGVQTTGVHAVNENGKWIRVSESRLATPIKPESNIVFDLGTTKHRIWVNGIEFGDDFETDNFFDFYNKPSIEALNKEEAEKLVVNV